MARLKPRIRIEKFNGVDGVEFELVDIIVLYGDRSKTSKTLDLLYTLFSTPPKISKWIDVVKDRDLEYIVNNYRELLKNFIDNFPAMTSLNMPMDLEGLREDTHIVLFGPSAKLLYINHWRSRWLECDYTILKHLRTIRLNDKIGVLLSNRLLTVFDHRDRDEALASIIGVAGYLLGYMLGPFHIGYRNILYIPNPTNNSKTAKRAREGLKYIIAKITGGSGSHDPIDILMKGSFNLPVMIIDDMVDKFINDKTLVIILRKTPHIILSIYDDKTHIKAENLFRELFRRYYISYSIIEL